MFEHGGNLTKNIPHDTIINYATEQIKSGLPQQEVEQNVKTKYKLDDAQARYFTRRAYLKKQGIISV